MAALEDLSPSYFALVAIPQIFLGFALAAWLATFFSLLRRLIHGLRPARGAAAFERR